MAALPSPQENVISLSDIRAERQLPPVPLSLEIEFSDPPEHSVPLGRRVWFAVAVSVLLWAVIAGAFWLI